MAVVFVSKAARNDLAAIRTYIQEDLSNPDASRRIIQEMRRHIEALADMPERGKQLDAIISVHTEFRYLVCENYRVFYLYDENKVEVVRVLHILQDFMRALFL